MTIDAYEKAMAPAIRSYDEYERVARDAGDFVRHVKVLGNSKDPRIPPGTVVVRVRGRLWRPLTPAQIDVVRRAIAVRQIVGVTLEVRD